MIEAALDARDAAALDAIAETYDQAVPEPEAADRLGDLADSGAPIVGFLGKLIPQKGVELVLAAQPQFTHDAEALIVGFGSYREWLAALAIALRPRRRDRPGLAPRGGLDADRRGRRGGTPDGGDVHRPARPPLRAGRPVGDGRAGGAVDPRGGLRHGRGRGGGGGRAAARRTPFWAGRGRRRAGSRGRTPGAVLVRARRRDRSTGSPQASTRCWDCPSRCERAPRRSVSAFVGREWTWDRTAARILAAW